MVGTNRRSEWCCTLSWIPISNLGCVALVKSLKLNTTVTLPNIVQQTYLRLLFSSESGDHFESLRQSYTLFIADGFVTNNTLSKATIQYNPRQCGRHPSKARTKTLEEATQY